jgi:hypothetical protein
MQLTQHTPQIWTIDNLLTQKECEDFIIFSENMGYVEAEVSFAEGAKMMKGLRNNYRLFYEDRQLAKDLWVKLAPFCPQNLDNNLNNSKKIIQNGINEQFRFYKYEVGQRFKRHIDGRFTRNAQEQSRITFMIYLNDDFEGGETTFDNLQIIPKAGTALCFIHEVKHEGSAIKGGIKYVLRSDVMYIRHLSEIT